MEWLVVISCVIFLAIYCIRTSPQNSNLGRKIAHNKNYREAWRIFEQLSDSILRKLSKKYIEKLEMSLIHRPYTSNPKKYDFINISHAIHQSTAQLLSSTVKSEYNEALKSLTQHGFLCLEALINIIWRDSSITNFTPEESDKISNKILSKLCAENSVGSGIDQDNLIAWKIYLGSCLPYTPYNKIFFDKNASEPSREKIFAYLETQIPRDSVFSDYDSFLEYKYNRIKSYLDSIYKNKQEKLKPIDPFVTY